MVITPRCLPFLLMCLVMMYHTVSHGRREAPRFHTHTHTHTDEQKHHHEENLQTHPLVVQSYPCTAVVDKTMDRPVPSAFNHLTQVDVSFLMA